ncbi:MAG: hypothetical protein ACOYL5_20705 [Phototrophicaceae bacterium]
MAKKTFTGMGQREAGQPPSYGDADELKALLGSQLAQVKSAIDDGLLVQAEDGWRFGRVTIGRVGIHVPDDLNEQEYSDLGVFLLDIGSRLNWLLGDWLAYGENRQWGETYQKVAEQFGYTAASLHQYAYVCRNVDFSTRVEKLSFAHHATVASLEPDMQRYWLGVAAEQGLSSKQLQQAITASKSSNILGATASRQWSKTLERLARDAHALDDGERVALAEELEALARALRALGS